MRATIEQAAGETSGVKTTRHLPVWPAVHTSGRPTDECPACGSARMCWVASLQNDAHYLCEACGRCWTIEPEGAVRVNPLACPGCRYRDRCIEELRREIPPWWWLPIDQ